MFSIRLTGQTDRQEIPRVVLVISFPNSVSPGTVFGLHISTHKHRNIFVSQRLTLNDTSNNNDTPRRAWVHRLPSVARQGMEPNSTKPPLESFAPCSDGLCLELPKRIGKLKRGVVRRDVNPFPDTVAWPPALPAARSAFACSVVSLARLRSGFPFASIMSGVYMASSGHFSP
jgi:hypothetical protein